MAKNSKRKSKRRRRRSSRENRAWDDTVYTWAVPIKAAVLIVFAVICMVAYAITLNSRNALHDAIVRQENKQIALMDDLQRETVKWQNMKTPGNLERRLLSHGIAMTRPRTGQRVAMSDAPAPNRNASQTTYADNR